MCFPYTHTNRMKIIAVLVVHNFFEREQIYVRTDLYGQDKGFAPTIVFLVALFLFRDFQLKANFLECGFQFVQLDLGIRVVLKQTLKYLKRILPCCADDTQQLLIVFGVNRGSLYIQFGEHTTILDKNQNKISDSSNYRYINSV